MKIELEIEAIHKYTYYIEDGDAEKVKQYAQNNDLTLKVAIEKLVEIGEDIWFSLVYDSVIRERILSAKEV